MVRTRDGFTRAVIPASERLDLRNVRDIVGGRKHTHLATEEEHPETLSRSGRGTRSRDAQRDHGGSDARQRLQPRRIGPVANGGGGVEAGHQEFGALRLAEVARTRGWSDA